MYKVEGEDREMVGIQCSFIDIEDGHEIWGGRGEREREGVVLKRMHELGGKAS